MDLMILSRTYRYRLFDHLEQMFKTICLSEFCFYQHHSSVRPSRPSRALWVEKLALRGATSR